MIDARFFPYKKWYNEYTDFERGLNVQDFLNKYPCDVFIVRHGTYALIQWFSHSTEWRIGFYGKGAVVFVRSFLAKKDDYVRGKSLNEIREFFHGILALHTAATIHDWDGADLIQLRMDSVFTQLSQKNVLSGLKLLTKARKLYVEKQYPSAIDDIKDAHDKHDSVDPELYAAALLQSGLGKWRSSNYGSAIEDMIHSLLIKDTFAATNNLVLMVWQIEKMGAEGNVVKDNLKNSDQEIISHWQEAGAQIIERKAQLINYDVESFANNISKVLENDDSARVMFMEPTWL
jgi:hypothetical protein